ncbi:hypothetical protein HDU76_006393, partial [Blyttiomyces sp. JEL0837]
MNWSGSAKRGNFTTWQQFGGKKSTNLLTQQSTPTMSLQPTDHDSIQIVVSFKHDNGELRSVAEDLKDSLLIQADGIRRSKLNVKLSNDATADLNNAQVIVYLINDDSMKDMAVEYEKTNQSNLYGDIQLGLKRLGEAKILPILMGSLQDDQHQSGTKCFKGFSAFQSTPADMPSFFKIDGVVMKGVYNEPVHKRWLLKSVLRFLSPPVQEANLPWDRFISFHIQNFTSRQPELSKLDTAIIFKGFASLHGPHGFGKSYIAARYVADRSTDYDHILWVNAESEKTLKMSAGAILKDRHVHCDDGDVWKAFREFLRTTMRYLLVIDNADDMKVLEVLFGDTSENVFAGDVIVTTRVDSSDFGKSAPKCLTNIDLIDVGKWEDSVVKEYLVKAFGRSESESKGTEYVVDEEDLKEMEALNEVVKIVDGSPNNAYHISTAMSREYVMKFLEFVNRAKDIVAGIPTERVTSNASVEKNDVTVTAKVVASQNKPTISANGEWKCQEHGFRDHDIFISYRVQSEKFVAEKLKSYLEGVGIRRFGRNVRVFLDSHCLAYGEDWEIGFLNGLKYSKMILYLISDSSMELLQRKINAKSQDNVFLEIEAGLKRLQESTPVKILPLLCGHVENDNTFVPFTHTDIEFYPDLPHLQGTVPVRDVMAQLFDRDMIKLDGMIDNDNFLGQVISSVLDTYNPTVSIDEDNRKFIPVLSTHFSGRTAELDAIATKLIKEGSVMIRGLAGMGKSSLMAEYARRHSHQYKHVFWVSLASSAAAHISFWKIYEYLQLNPKKDHRPDDEEVRIAVCKWSNENRGYLLCLDNADDVDVVKAMMGDIKKFGGELLITSRNPNIHLELSVSANSVVELDKWTLDVAKEFMFTSLAGSKELCENNSQENGALDMLLDQLDGLPLVVVQASGQIGTMEKISFVEYLTDLASARDLIPQDEEGGGLRVVFQVS